MPGSASISKMYMEPSRGRGRSNKIAAFTAESSAIGSDFSLGTDLPPMRADAGDGRQLDAKVKLLNELCEQVPIVSQGGGRRVCFFSAAARFDGETFFG